MIRFIHQRGGERVFKRLRAGSNRIWINSSNDNKQLVIRRTLEFISQELGRELNTLSAKANDAEISQIVVQCKAKLEKIREQVQNVE